MSEDFRTTIREVRGSATRGLDLFAIVAKHISYIAAIKHLSVEVQLGFSAFPDGEFSSAVIDHSRCSSVSVLSDFFKLKLGYQLI